MVDIELTRKFLTEALERHGNPDLKFIRLYEGEVLVATDGYRMHIVRTVGKYKDGLYVPYLRRLYRVGKKDPISEKIWQIYQDFMAKERVEYELEMPEFSKDQVEAFSYSEHRFYLKMENGKARFAGIDALHQKDLVPLQVQFLMQAIQSLGTNRLWFLGRHELPVIVGDPDGSMALIMPMSLIE